MLYPATILTQWIIPENPVASSLVVVVVVVVVGAFSPVLGFVVVVRLHKEGDVEDVAPLLERAWFPTWGRRRRRTLRTQRLFAVVFLFPSRRSLLITIVVVELVEALCSSPSVQLGYSDNERPPDTNTPMQRLL